MARYIVWTLESGLQVRIREASSLPGQHRPHAMQPFTTPAAPATNHRTITVARFAPLPLAKASGATTRRHKVTIPYFGLDDPMWGRRPQVPTSALALVNAAIVIAT